MPWSGAGMPMCKGLGDIANSYGVLENWREKEVIFSFSVGHK